MDAETKTYNAELCDILKSPSFDGVTKLTVSNKRNAAAKYNKITARRISVSGKEAYQLECFTDKQCFHENLEPDKLHEKLYDLLTTDFRQLDGETVRDGVRRSVALKISKKGKVLFTEKRIAGDAVKVVFDHNRTKNYIIPEGTYIPVLHDLGVITADGKVVNRMYDKWKQINRFIELVSDAVKNDSRECFNIIDFGCGKSYLTFVLYHYFTAILGKRVNVVGLDLKSDVIEHCNKAAEKYGYESLHFFCGDIKDYSADFKPDIVITLHACDTATDYALYNSIKWGADYIFSVPCCQHEVNGSIKADKLSAMCGYGIIKERLSALVTDTVRAKLLEYCGYKTELLEFIDIAHSPKNLLIRARKRGVRCEDRQKAAAELKKMRTELSFDHTLLRLVEEDGSLVGETHL
mgnify:FL=1